MCADSEYCQHALIPDVLSVVPAPRTQRVVSGVMQRPGVLNSKHGAEEADKGAKNRGVEHQIKR